MRVPVTFHDVARRISLRTYQERLLGSGLPDSPEFIATMLAPIASDDAKILCLDIGLSSPWTQCVGSLAHTCHYYPGVHFYFYRSSGGCQLILHQW